MRKSHSILLIALFTFSLAATVFAAEGTSAGVVNINSADASQLVLLPRVGQKAALRIIEYRKQHGPFKKATDLMQVKGFGDKTFEGLSAYITVDGDTTLKSKVASPRRPRKQPTNAASN